MNIKEVLLRVVLWAILLVPLYIVGFIAGYYGSALIEHIIDRIIYK